MCRAAAVVLCPSRRAAVSCSRAERNRQYREEAMGEIRFEQVTRSYGSGEAMVRALDGVSFLSARGSSVSS